MVYQSIRKRSYPESEKLRSEIIDFYHSTQPRFSSLEQLHQFCPSTTLKKGTDQSTIFHNILYAQFDKALESPIVFSYRCLVNAWLEDLRQEYGYESWAVQRYPSLRIHFPNNLSVYEFHRDSDYNHPLGEINHFLALTKCFGSAALNVEKNLGWSDYEPLELNQCQSAILNTSIFKHGDFPNLESYTRFSIDFRAIPLSVLNSPDNISKVSPTKSKAMTTSDYFVLDSNIFNE